MVDAHALGRLVGDVAGFLDSCWGTAPLHVRAAEAGGSTPHDLLTLEDVDTLVATSGLRAPAFRLVRHGATLPRSSVTRRARIGSQPVTDLVDVAAVHRAVAGGATLVLQGLHRSFPPVAAFCRDLERTLTHAVQANAYLTPPVAQGLNLHEDPHDVFVIQTYGSKRWVVHPPGTRDGIEGGAEDGAVGGPEDPWDLELTPGDVLYLPTGTRHAAQTQRTPSLHLTIGVRTVTWDAVVERAVTDALAELVAEHEQLAPATPLPVGWAHHPELLEDEVATRVSELADRLGERLRRAAVVPRASDGPTDGPAAGPAGGPTGGLADGPTTGRTEGPTTEPSVDPSRVMARQAERFWAGRTPDLSGGLRDLLQLDQLRDDTPLRRRDDVTAHVRGTGDDRVEVVLRDRVLRMPATIAPALGHCLAAASLRPSDLDPYLDVDSRMVLCRRLVREGVLAVDRATDDRHDAQGG